MRMANLCANICQVGDQDGLEDCFEMVTARPARLMCLPDYGIEVGNPADLVMLDCERRAEAVTEVVYPIMGLLTLAHVWDKRLEVTSPLNLAGLCQRCHNQWDARDLLASRIRRQIVRRLMASQLVLPDPAVLSLGIGSLPGLAGGRVGEAAL